MAIENEKDILQLRKRFQDLARRSYEQNIFTFTPMLGLAEQTVFWEAEPSLRYAGYAIDGGRENAERVMIRFGNEKDLGYAEAFPISLVHIRSLQAKFSDDFTHRDFLGALMHLGIERDLLGDILVGEKQGYLFYQTSIVDFLCRELKQVKHTTVICEPAASVTEYQETPPVSETILVASERLDAVISQVYHLSRSQSIELFRKKQVFVSGRLCENNSRDCKAGEVISVRGYGRLIYDGIDHTTKKGKQSVNLRVYR
ncbi:MAG: YlmH/Sll1252 family protein [Lachnospiraceae bacterium]|nr:YlmH/Sll1252 family protein [Lachnospiraceae bacterium]